MPLLGFKTIRAGESAAVWSSNGTCKVVNGPKRVTLVRQRLERLRKFYADESSYLEIRKVTGETVILPGPASAFQDPLEDVSVAERRAIFIDASQALVVYRNEPSRAEKQCSVMRRVVHGPARFVPAANEWVHDFSWSGVPTNGSKTTIQPHANKFTALSVIPSQLYHNVNEVRTNDDTLITVKLMIFYSLVDVETMLATTADPIADFINAASADVVAFCAGVNYEDFLTLTDKLNQLATFAQLTHKAAADGYKVTKVVFRGFQAGEKLQAMHDNAIQERTRLRLKEETEAQEQRAADMRLDAERARATRQAQLEVEQAKTRAELSRQAKEAELAEARMASDAALTAAEAQARQALEAEKNRQQLEQGRHAQTLDALRTMKELGVDLTKVLVSQHEHPDRVVRVETGAPAAATKGGGAGVGGLLSGLQLQMGV